MALNTDTIALNLPSAGPATERPVSIAIVAMGGQGGGVLSDWIVQLAESQGWVAQSTSVPGVAQRTGATIYYVEVMQFDATGRKPVLSQMPTPGDVDVVIASEFMEAGRSIMRGLVTPDRTILIASSHRALATVEKIVPGSGIAQNGAVDDAILVAARKRIVFDMELLARANGSVISSSMFGSLAASGALPFDREAYHAVIRQGGKGVEASIRAFDAAFERAIRIDDEPAPTPEPAAPPFMLPASLPDRRADALLQRLRRELPDPAHHMAFLGLSKVVAFQDVAYGEEYLGQLAELSQRDREAGGEGRGFAFTVQAAKYLANAMVYDDIIRVADLKTRTRRRGRIEQEVGLKEGQLLGTTEFFHPRMDEFVSMLPKGIANWLIARPRLYAWLDRRINKGRRVSTYSVGWFLVLYVVGGMRSLRRGSLRHAVELKHREAWLATARGALAGNYALAVEILGFQRLIKGYSDTHARGLSKFDRVMAATLHIADRPDAAKWARLLMNSATKDADMAELEGTIKTIESFS